MVTSVSSSISFHHYKSTKHIRGSVIFEHLNVFIFIEVKGTFHLGQGHLGNLLYECFIDGVFLYVKLAFSKKCNIAI